MTIHNLNVPESLAFFGPVLGQVSADIPSSWWRLNSFVGAFVISAVSAPIIALFARRTGLVDRPDGHRKLHTRPIPLTGGPIILLATSITVSLTLWYYPGLMDLDSEDGDMPFLMGLFISALIIVLVGLVDDRIGLRGRPAR